MLLVAAAPMLGGAERILLDWAGALERPAVLACPPGPLADAASAAGLHVAALADRPLRRRGRSGRAGRDLAALARDVAALARQHRPAVVVASGQRPLLAAAWTALGGARLLALQHDLPPGPSIARLLRAASARADAVVALSGAIARAADPAGRRLGRTHVIHPGVDLDRWSLPDPPPGPPRALCLGALVHWKRADLALEIAARIPDLRLELAGAPLPGDPPGFATALHERAARAGPGRPRAVPRRGRRPAARARRGALPAALRRPRAVRARAGRGARRRAPGRGAGRRRPAGDRHAGERAALPRPATPAPAPPRCGRCSPTRAAPAAARARAAAFDGAAARPPLRRARRRPRRRQPSPLAWRAMRRAVPAVAAACLLAGPTVLAFFSGGYFTEPRLLAAIVVWALVLALALAGPAPLPREPPGPRCCSAGSSR